MRGRAWLGCLVVLVAIVSGCGATTQERVDAAALQPGTNAAPAPSPVATGTQYAAAMCDLTNTLAGAVTTLDAVDGRAASTVKAGVVGLPAVLSRADALFTSVERWPHAVSATFAEPANEAESLLAGVSPHLSSVAPTTRLVELVLRAAELDLALDEQGGQTTTGLTSRLVRAFASARVAIAGELGFALPSQVPLGYRIACPPPA